jgi:hypothetical protein
MSATPTDHPPSQASAAVRWLAGALAVLVCLGVFGMYTVPDFMVMLADQVWACF